MGLHKKMTIYLFLCTFCRIKRIINCLYFLNSPHIPFSPFTFSPLIPNILLSSLFPNTLRLDSSLRVGGCDSDSGISGRILSCKTHTGQIGLIL